MAVTWFVVALILLMFLLVMALCRVAGETNDEYTENMAPTAKPISEETTLHPQTVWTRYDVPLDDDLQRYIYDLCQDYDVDMAMVLAVIERESGYDAEKVGDGGKSWGLMQIYSTQHTARCVRLGAWNLLDPKHNVRVGIDYLSELLGIGHGPEWALSFYNGHGGEECDYATSVMDRAKEIEQTKEYRYE